MKLPELVKDIAEKGDLLETDSGGAKKIPPYLVNYWLAQRRPYVRLINEVQHYLGMDRIQYFTLLKSFLPKNKGFHKFVKRGKKEEVHEWLAKYFKVDRKTAIVYTRLLTQEQIHSILRKFGESTRPLLKSMGVKEKKTKRSLRDY